jgi:hypothetical protein
LNGYYIQKTTLLPPVGSRDVGVMQLELEDNHLAVFGVKVKHAW